MLFLSRRNRRIIQFLSQQTRIILDLIVLRPLIIVSTDLLLPKRIRYFLTKINRYEGLRQLDPDAELVIEGLE